MQDQVRFWNDWNAATRERHVSATSRDQARVALEWLAPLGRRDLALLDAGCGAGWMCEQLAPFGQVTGTDLADAVLERAAARLPHVRFVAGDFLALPFDAQAFDVIVSFELIAHVQDPVTVVERFARLLKPGGMLVLATQNPWVLARSTVDPVQPGQIRRWLSRRELRALLAPHFRVEEIRTVTPHGDRGVLRLVNSVKLNAIAAALLGAERVRALKERAGLGRTLIVRATLRAP